MLKCDEFETLIVVDVGRKGPWWMLKKKDRRVELRFLTLEMVVDRQVKQGRVLKMMLLGYFLTFSWVTMANQCF